MLLDAIFLIPTLFTYCLILLLIFILCFIVVYISHKIYISVYDNLPLSAGPGSNRMMSMRDYLEKSTSRSVRSMQASMRSIWIPNRSQIDVSTSVRIILTLEPCYLVSVEYDIDSRDRAISFMCRCQQDNAPVCAATVHHDQRPSTTHIVRYYDHLTKIPRLRVMLKCNQRGSDTHMDSHMRVTLDDVIMNALDAHCTDSAAACRAPYQRRFTAQRDQE
ncbi:uncharacterized protein [Drosophila tropicalis]|uniref:uncharacterized protein n=1 Tax=Drosophila tropicalis TaxID=46794 RepID=UPI0035ABD413